MGRPCRIPQLPHIPPWPSHFTAIHLKFYIKLCQEKSSASKPKMFENFSHKHSHLTDTETSPWRGNNTSKGPELVSREGQIQTPSPCP